LPAGVDGEANVTCILIISDVHANVVALDAVLSQVGDIDDVWSLGDIVGYGPRPRQCMDLVRTMAATVSVPGNHYWACIGQLSLDDFNPLAQAAARWTSTQLDPDHTRYLGKLPNRITIGAWTIVHGCPREPLSEYIYDPRQAASNFPYFDNRLCLVGHTHLQLYTTESEAFAAVAPHRPADGDVLDLSAERMIINPGSVGQPRDGDPRAACALVDLESESITFRGIPYAISETQREMREEGLPERLVTRLSLGV
jgi:diadenosine tetraphosphatase ApaH/serine/threonine PP2A family protein phosphatase